MMDKIEKDFEAMLLRDLAEAKEKAFTDRELVLIEYCANVVSAIEGFSNPFNDENCDIAGVHILLEKVRKM